MAILSGLNLESIIKELGSSKNPTQGNVKLVQVQLCILRAMSTKLQKEMNDRMKIEKQFEDIMERYRRQMELIDKKI